MFVYKYLKLITTTIVGKISAREQSRALHPSLRPPLNKGCLKESSIISQFYINIHNLFIFIFSLLINFT